MSDEQRDSRAVGGGLKTGAFRPVPLEVLRAVGPGPALTYAALTRFIDKGRDFMCPVSLARIAQDRRVSRDTARRHVHKLADAGFVATFVEVSDAQPRGRQPYRLFVNDGAVYQKGNDPLRKGQTAGWLRVPVALWTAGMSDAATLLTAYCLSLTRRATWKAVAGECGLRDKRALWRARDEAREAGWLSWPDSPGQRPLFAVCQPEMTASAPPKSAESLAETHPDPLQERTIPPLQERTTPLAETHHPTDQSLYKNRGQEHQPDESKLRNSKRLPDEVSRLVSSHFGEKARERLDEATTTARQEHGDALADKALAELERDKAKVDRSPALYFKGIVARLAKEAASVLATARREQRGVLDQLADAFGPEIVGEFAASPAYDPHALWDRAPARKATRGKEATRLYLEAPFWEQPDKLPSGVLPAALYAWALDAKGRDLAVEFSLRRQREAPARRKAAGIVREAAATITARLERPIAEDAPIGKGEAAKALAALSIEDWRDVRKLQLVAQLARQTREKGVLRELTRLILMLEADPGPPEAGRGIEAERVALDELAEGIGPPALDGEAVGTELELAEVA